MKRILLIAIVLLLSLSPYSSKADSPIYTGLLWDTAPSVAYNSRDGEFLVVWNMYNYLFPFPDVRFFGPLMGQLYK